ncbi:hypothetical protein BBJ28_00017464 [Nothophytophthora sp. Chile5]|nr:hypothetical protein BBJ28_00017464 [Nothophytophthora sp. Chile5]
MEASYVTALLSPLVLGLLTATAAFTLYSTSGRGFHAAKNVPAGATLVSDLPSASPILGHIMEMVRNRSRLHDWLAEKSLEREGKLFVLRFPRRSDLVVTRPEDLEQILKVQAANFAKGEPLHEILRDFMGDGILLVNGDRWKYHRRVLVSLFSARALRDQMTAIIQRNTLVLQEILAKAAETQQPLDLYKLMNKFTLETFAEIGFGRKLDNLASDKDHPFEIAFDEANRLAVARMTGSKWRWKLKRWLNVGSERRLRDAMIVIDEFVMDTVSSAIERRQLRSELAAQDDLAHPTERDIVSIILDTMEAGGHAVTPSEVRDIAMAGLIAGRDTTADALSWLLHVLHQNPRVEGKLRAEIREELPKFGDSMSYLPSMEEVQELPYLEAMIRELLRLFPSVPVIPYHCVSNTVFPDGTFIPKGIDIMLSLYASGRLTSVWGPDAAEFVPERFLDGETGKLLQMPPTTLAAFSAGPRACVGQRLAMLEMKIVATCLVSRFHLVEAPGQNVTYSWGLSLRMKHPLMVRVEPLPTADAQTPNPSALSA